METKKLKFKWNNGAYVVVHVAQGSWDDVAQLVNQYGTPDEVTLVK